MQGGRGAGELVVRTSATYDVLRGEGRSRTGAPDVPLRNVRTMDEVLARRWPAQVHMLLIGLSACSAW
jgi:hypothetical protein